MNARVTVAIAGTLTLLLGLAGLLYPVRVLAFLGFMVESLSQSAAALELSSGKAVMAIGGFSGSDPAPTLAEFERDVSAGKVHYFVAGGAMGGGPGGGASTSAGQIADWVQSHFTATTVGGQTVYDLSQPSGG